MALLYSEYIVSSIAAKILGANIKAIREGMKLSQAALAKAVGTNASTVSHWESGRSLPSGKQIDSLRTALGVPYEILFSSASKPQFKPKDPRDLTPKLTIYDALKVVNEHIGDLVIKKSRQK